MTTLLAEPFQIVLVHSALSELETHPLLKFRKYSTCSTVLSDRLEKYYLGSPVHIDMADGLITKVDRCARVTGAVIEEYWGNVPQNRGAEGGMIEAPKASSGVGYGMGIQPTRGCGERRAGLPSEV